jgi:polysaccharide biosynthesis protein PslH
MKILVLLSRVPYPLEKGDKLRAYHQLKGISKNHEVYLIALNDTELHPDALDNLKSFCKEVYIFKLSKFSILFNLFKGYFSSKPYQVNYFYNNGIFNEIQNIIKTIKPDRIYCQLVRMSEYVKHINHIPKTLDFMDAFSKGIERRIKTSTWLLRPVFRQEYQRLKNYEHLMYHYFENHIIISEQDREYIAHEENFKIEIVPNGVDTDFFNNNPVEPKFDLLFTGNMNYPPNIDCAVFLSEKVIPALSQKYPDIKLLISGAQPAPRVKSLSNKNVIVGGWVSDIRESFAQSKIFVAPMQIGTGLQNKLLEAMSMKLPCITSSLANQALGAPEGECILVGNTPEEISELIISLLENPVESKRLAEKGHEFVQENFSWDTHNKKLENIIVG